MFKEAVGIIGGADGPTVVFTSDGEVLRWWPLLLAVLIAYLIGNISPSTIMAKSRGLDIKKEGSGNAGTTNALRVMGKKAGVITLVVDVLKGVLAVLLGQYLSAALGGDGLAPIAAALCALAVFLGHVWPVVYKFKGGKGVATAFGAIMGLNPLLGVIVLAVVVVFVLLTKRMSVGSIIGAAAFPFLALWLEPFFFSPGLVMAIIVIVKHRSNIVRLCKGQEPIMSIFEKKDNTADQNGDSEKDDKED